MLFGPGDDDDEPVPGTEDDYWIEDRDHEPYADDDDDEEDAPAKVVHAWVVSVTTGSCPWNPAIAALEISTVTLSAICTFTDLSAIFEMVP